MTHSKPVPALSTHLFAYSPLDTRMIDLAAEAGFSRLEVFAAPQHFPIDDRDLAGKILAGTERAGMKLAALHAPFYDSVRELRAGRIYALGDRSQELRAAALAAMKTLLPLAADLGSPHIVLHMGHRTDAETDAGLFLAGVEEVLETCPAYAGRLLVENTPDVARRPEEFALLRSHSDPARTGFCIDTGHLFLNAGGDPACGLDGRGQPGEDPMATILAATYHFHIHDNQGDRDEHLPPGEGGIDWDKILNRLPECPEDSSFCLELRDGSRGVLTAEELLKNGLDRISGPVRRFLRREGIKL
jgi:sugar phosphate isomerase/epimerase